VRISRLEVLVEEPSAEALLRTLFPKMVPSLDFRFHVFQGKKDLLAKLPGRLLGYAKYLPPDACVLVLVDRDSDDCLRLKAGLRATVLEAGLAVWSFAPGAAPAGTGQGTGVVNRIVVEELEAWYFGDWEAVRRVYPRLSPRLAGHAAFRRPDAVEGGTWERFERMLRDAGHLRGRLPKIRTACGMAPHMDPDRNRSPSFRCLRHALRGLAGYADP